MSGVKGRGAFILFEGMDRCGKSTQVKLLSNHLKKIVADGGVEDIRFPNRQSHIGQLIDSYLSSASNLNDQTIHLLFSANRWEMSKEIEAKLNSGITLICDRYAYSGVAYSSAKGLNTEWCKSGDVGLPRPDCIIFMNMPVEEAAKRGQYGEERYEKLDFQRVIQQKFLELQEEDRIASMEAIKLGSASDYGEWMVVDATKSIEEIHEKIKEHTIQVLERVKDRPIGSLWTEPKKL